MDTSRLPRWARSDDSKRRYALLGAAATLVLVLYAFFRHASNPELLYVPVEKTEDGTCMRTLLYRFDDRRGFGSEITMFARAVLLANTRGYALLIDDSRWNYGRLSDYFIPRSEGCNLPADADQLARTEVGQQDWENADHLLSHRFVSQAVDKWVAQTFIDLRGLWALPSIDFSHALAHERILPPPLSKVYNALYAVHEELFRLQPDILEAVKELEKEYGLHEIERSPVIGLHYRGGDKISIECTLETNCANTTIYSRAAVTALQHVSVNTCEGCRPVLALMTVEPHMGDVFREESLVQEHFEVKQLPPSPAAGIAHDEDHFLALPIETRIADTKAMIRDIVFLCAKADAVVASMRSNVGLVMAQWTPRGHVLPYSIDSTYWGLSWNLEALGLYPPR